MRFDLCTPRQTENVICDDVNAWHRIGQIAYATKIVFSLRFLTADWPQKWCAHVHRSRQCVECQLTFSFQSFSSSQFLTFGCTNTTIAKRTMYSNSILFLSTKIIIIFRLFSFFLVHLRELKTNVEQHRRNKTIRLVCSLFCWKWINTPGKKTTKTTYHKLEQTHTHAQTVNFCKRKKNIRIDRRSNYNFGFDFSVLLSLNLFKVGVFHHDFLCSRFVLGFAKRG